MRVAIVVAATDDGVIGKGNALPWRLPDDLKYFKAITLGKPVIMGRRTFESIGKPLPGRTNIVISRKKGFEAIGCITVTSIDAALLAAGDVSEICVIGGGEIYRQILPRTDTIYLTRVHAEVDGDVFFPPLDAGHWREVRRDDHPTDERHIFPFTFVTLERIK
jgi:dihydrofolate reductase